MPRPTPTPNPYTKLADPRCPHCQGGAYVAKVSPTFGTRYLGICACVPRLRTAQPAYAR